MNYAKEFGLDILGDSCAAVNKARDAGKSDELLRLIEQKFDGRCETLAEIRKYIDLHENNLLREIGLSPDGKPLGEKKFKVFVRINCVTEFEVDAKNPEDARKIANEIIWEDPGNCLIDINRDDIETAVPVAYEEPESFETKDYGPSEEERKEFSNALAGREMWSLVEVETESGYDHCVINVPSSSLFMSFDEAYAEMDKAYHRKIDKMSDDDVNFFQDPKDGEDTCYVTDVDGYETRWKINKVSFKVG